MALAGYNIAFKLGIVSGNTTTYKTFAGRTQDDLTIAARTRERLTKDDAGATSVAVIGQDITFRATGLVELTSSTAITRDQLVALLAQREGYTVLNSNVVYSAKTGGQCRLRFPVCHQQQRPAVRQLRHH